MQDLVKVYEENKDLIQKFIISSLRQIDVFNGHDDNRLFDIFPSLELIYETDANIIQTTANTYRNKSDASVVGMSRSYLFGDSSKETFFNDPYISTATGKLCVTLVFKTSQGYVFLDFKLRSLLERFDLIVGQKGFNRFNKYAYILIAGGLIFFGIFISIYGFYSFADFFINSSDISLDVVFKPVIALTLGMAVYDLGKTILEHEVLPKTQNTGNGFKIKTLVNFLVSIIIALFIEALLVVFKISIHDYKDMHYAAVLIIALALLLYVFAFFGKTVKKI